MNYIKNTSANLYQARFLDKYMSEHSGFIAGGCFKNIFLKEKVKDIDIFFETQKDFDNTLKLYNKKETCGDCIKLYTNSKAISFLELEKNVKIDLVRSVFGTPEEILHKFDFTIAKCAYFKETIVKQTDDGETESETIEYRLLYHADFFEHLLTKRLTLDENIPFPESTWERSYRYKGYGFNMCRESKVKLLKALKESTNDIEDNVSFYNLGGWD
jgi:hypothetical protein